MFSCKTLPLQHKTGIMHTIVLPGAGRRERHELFCRGRTFFDVLKQGWEQPTTQRRVSLTLITLFLLVLGLTEINRLGRLPSTLAPFISRNNFQAIHLAFSMLLFLEVIGLILSIPGPMARSVGKQIEILSLILLRTSFEQLGVMHEPVKLRIAATSSAAVALYGFLRIFYRIAQPDNTLRTRELNALILVKKLISLCVFGVLAIVAAHDVFSSATGARGVLFFETIYTVMIFVDITLVLVSQHFLPHYRDVFRNSGKD